MAECTSVVSKVKYRIFIINEGKFLFLEDEEDEMVNAMENISETDFNFDDFVKR